MISALLWCALAAAEPPRPAASCPRLFGNAEQRSANAARRKQLLHDAHESDYAIDVTYSGDWSLPRPIRLRGVRFLSTKNGAAIVDIGQELASAAGCVGGRYELRADDKLGKKNVLVAVFQHALLFERSGQLVYIAPQELDPRFFRMTWRADFSLPHPRTAVVPVAPPRPGVPTRR